jgi:uncharacterized protein
VAPHGAAVNRSESGIVHVLYLHGFASSPTGRKVTALRNALVADGSTIAAPDLNLPSFERLDFDRMVDEAELQAGRKAPDVVVGSSLGAMVALGLAKRRPVPLLLVAPALGFGPRWTAKIPESELVPFFHHGENAALPIHRRFFERMAASDVDREPPHARVAVVMGTADESVPFDAVEETWKRWERSEQLLPGSFFEPVPGGDHSLVELVPRLVEICRELATPVE